MLSNKLYLVFLGVIVLVYSNNTTNTTSQTGPNFAPLPPINETYLFDIHNSSADGHLIISKQMESLDLVHFPAGNGTNITNITLHLFNRTAPGMQTTFRLTLPGNWTHIESSPASLSCTIIYETVSGLIGPIKFDKRNGTFQMMTYLPLTNLTNGTNLTVTEIRNLIHVGENCVLLSITSPPFYSVYTEANNWTTYTMVTLPTQNSTTNPKLASTNDLIFSIWNHTVYHYNASTRAYQSAFNFSQGFMSYQIHSYRNRVIVVGKVTVPIPNMPTLQLSNYTFFAFNFRGQTLIPVGNYTAANVTELINQTNLVYFTSPRLSKVGMYFAKLLPSGQTMEVVEGLNIDYGRNRLFNMTIENMTELTALLRTIKYVYREVDMSEEFLVLKNVTAFNASNPAPVIEVVYQMVGNRLVFLRMRQVTNMTQIATFLLTNVDLTATFSCYIFNVYILPNTSSYQVFQFAYGNLASTYRILEPQPTPYISFLEPPGRRIPSQSNLLRWLY